MAHAFHGSFNGFLIKNAAVIQGNVQPKPLLYQAAEDFQLYLAHDLDMDLTVLPKQMELGVFLFQLAQLGQRHRRVGSLGKVHPVGHHRLQRVGLSRRLRAQGLARVGFGKARHRRDLAWGDFIGGGEFVGRIDAQLHRFFLPAFPFLVYIIQNGAYLQGTAGDLQPGQAAALRIPGNLVYFRGKFGGIVRFRGVFVQNFQKFFHALQLQAGAEAAGEQLSLGDEATEVALGHGATFQIIFQQGVVAHGGVFGDGRKVRAKVHAARGQLLLQLPQQRFPLRARQVHLVDEQEGGHVVTFQQTP